MRKGYSQIVPLSRLIQEAYQTAWITKLGKESNNFKKATMRSQEQLVWNSDFVIKTEILNIYKDYQSLPNRIQNDLSFNEYMDFYLEQLNKTDMAKQKYLELAQDLFAREQHTGVYEETSINQNYPEIEK